MMMRLLTLYLFVRKRRERDEVVFRVQSLVQPVEVFVSPGHLDVVKLENISVLELRLTSPVNVQDWLCNTYTGSQLVRDVALQPLELGLLLGRGDHAGVWRLRGLPAVAALRRLHDAQHLGLGDWEVYLAQDVVLASGLHKHGEPVEACLARGGGAAGLPSCKVQSATS